MKIFNRPIGELEVKIKFIIGFYLNIRDFGLPLDSAVRIYLAIPGRIPQVYLMNSLNRPTVLWKLPFPTRRGKDPDFHFENELVQSRLS